MAVPCVALFCALLAGCAQPNGTQRPAGAQAARPAPSSRIAAPAPQQQQTMPGGPTRPRLPVVSPPPQPVPALPPVPEVQNGNVILTPPPGVTQRIGVGFLAPLSGADAGLGRALLDAAQLALFDVAGDAFTLLPRDTQGVPKGAASAAISAIEDGAQLLLGPLYAHSVVEVAALARAAAMSVVAFSNDRAVAQQDAFVVGFRPETAVRRVVGFAASKGKLRFAALLPDDAYGQRVAEAFRAAAAASGGTVEALAFYGNSEESMTAAVRNLARYEARRNALAARKAELSQSGGEAAERALKRLEGLDTLGDLPFDALLVAETGAALKALAPLLPFYDIDTRDVRILGIDGRPGPELEREPALTGAWFAVPSPEARKGFEDRFRQTYGRAPHPLGMLAYDATALAAVLAGAGQDGKPAFGLPALTAPNGFAGAAGTFRLLPDGTVDRQLAVVELRPAGAVVVAPAPQTFQAVGN